MQFLSENRRNGCQILGRLGFLKQESELIFGFPHIAESRDNRILSHTSQASRQCRLVVQLTLELDSL